MSEPQDENATKYVVLQQSKDDVAVWGVESYVVARSAPAAIKAALSASGAAQPPDGTYVAVPERSWRPMDVRAKQTTTLTLEDAAF